MINFYLHNFLRKIVHKQDSSSPEQLTTKRPPEQMTTAENELSNQTFKKLRATKGISNNTEKNVGGDLTAGTPLRAVGTATMQEKVSEIPSRSHQTEEQLRNLSCRNADMKESTDVTGQFDPPSFVCHPNLTIQDAKNTPMAILSHSHPITMSGNVPVKYPAPQMNSSWTSENDSYVPLRQFISWNSPLSNLSNNSPNVNTQVSKALSLFVTSVINIDIKDCINMVTTAILVGRSMLHAPINCLYVICGPSFCSTKLYLHLHS